TSSSSYFPITSPLWFFTLFHICPVFHYFLSLSILKSKISQELANSQESLDDSDSSNRKLVRTLYEALSSRDLNTVIKIVATDLDWWFHGPPSHQFLMRMLTGAPSSDTFQFVPQSITSFGPTVLAEGYDHSRSISWVHAWTVTDDGIITQIREYLNTSLTVTRIRNSNRSSSTPEIKSASSSLHCPSVWESSLSNQDGKSMPGLVLAI
ncbi:Wound-induced protein 1-like, partial [Quillaja saponaria]